MLPILKAFGEDLSRKPGEITEEIAAVVVEEDLRIDGQSGFKGVVSVARGLKLPVVFRPNLERKPKDVQADTSCALAQVLRRFTPEERDRGQEIRTLVFGPSKPIQGVVAVHMPHEVRVDNRKLRDAVRANCNGTISWNPSNMSAAKPDVLQVNGLGELGNGLFNPLTTPPKGNILHVFDSTLRDLAGTVCSTNAGSRGVGLFFDPNELALTIIASCVDTGDSVHAVFADLGKYNLDEI